MSADDRTLFVPGRLCLFGEHSDWAAGYRTTHPEIRPGRCVVVGTDQGLRAEVAPLDDVLEIRSRLPSGEVIGPVRIDAHPSALEAATRRHDFLSYATGTAAEVARRFPALAGRGLRLDIASDLPVRKGLSSSAAICVLTARAYARAYGQALGPGDEMEIAYAGERRTGSECGRMDQVCAYGRQVSALRFDGDAFAVSAVAPGGSFHLLVVDLGRGKDTRRILADLNRCYPDRVDPVAVAVREALGPINERVFADASAAIEAGDAARLGALMREAQAVFDERVAPACPELAAPALHAVLAHPAVAELGYGAKGVGSQGDGCVQIVARGPDERAELAERLGRDGLVCIPLTIEAD